jgi:RNA recognition motif-containing protein
MSFCPPLFDAPQGQPATPTTMRSESHHPAGRTVTRRLRYHNKHHTVFVTRLPPDANERTLADAFSPFGFVVGVYVERNERGDSMNFAFVELDSEQGAASAVRDMDRQMIKGPEPHVAARCVTVDFVRGSRAANLLGDRTRDNEAAAPPPLSRSPGATNKPPTLSPYSRAADAPAASPPSPLTQAPRSDRPHHGQYHHDHHARYDDHRGREHYHRYGPPPSHRYEDRHYHHYRYGGPPPHDDRYNYYGGPPPPPHDDRYRYGGPPPPPPHDDRYRYGGPPPPPPHDDRYRYGGPPPHDDRYRYGSPPPPPAHDDRYRYGGPPPPAPPHDDRYRYGGPPPPPPPAPHDERYGYGPPPGAHDDRPHHHHHGASPPLAIPEGAVAYDPCSPGMDDGSNSPAYSPATPPPPPPPHQDVPSALSMLASMLRSSEEGSTAGFAPSGHSAPLAPASHPAAAAEVPARQSEVHLASDEGVPMPDQSPTPWRQHVGVVPRELVVIDETEEDEATPDGGP